MKFFKVLLVQSLFLLFFYLPASAQNDLGVLNQIMTKTAKLYTDYPIEKVYLHFDKPYYAVGDTIWFKAYLTVDRHVPSTISKIIYVDVFGPRDTLMQSLKLQAKNSVAWSSFQLSTASYKKGTYRVVAYTNWMGNAGPAYFFSKNITLGDAINNTVYAQVSLKTATVNKQPKVTAAIFYNDDEGKPLSDKRVSWIVQKDGDALFKGRSTTDKNGFVDINFINLKNYRLDSARIVATVDDANGKPSTSSFPLKSIAHPNDVQFFPEGGELLEGIKNKIAFKALKPDGLGIDLKGSIVDNAGQVVTEFKSSHLGMGAFEFTPENGKTYTAKVTYADGSSASPALPKIQTGGINLRIDNSNPDALGVKILADGPFLQQYKGKTFFLVGKCSGLIVYAAKMILNETVYNASIPKTKFPTGIVQITLFTDDGDPLTERIAFIQHNDQLNLSVKSEVPAYTTRQKVKLNITAKNNNQPDEGNFSIAVVDDSKVPFDDDAETTILTNLLLTSDIKGYIEKPNYYFNHADEKTLADLDVLMLTQGYRRFSYDGILNNKYPRINYLPEQGIQITGTLRASNGIPIKGGNITLRIPDRSYAANTVTNDEGRFVFPNLVFSDSAKVIVSARNNPKANDLVVTVDGEPVQSIAPNLTAPDEILNIDTALKPYLKNSKIHYNGLHILKEVVIKEKKIVPLVSHRDYPSLSSLGNEADHLITGDRLSGCPAFLECLKAFATGMTYDESTRKFYVSRDYNQGKKVPAQVFLSGMPIDVESINSVNGAEVESVEVFLRDELGLVNSANNSNGAIEINMRKVEKTKISLSDLKALFPARNEVAFLPKGYTPVRSFYLPRYTGPRQLQPSQTDTRSTVYWNPNVTTDKTTGSASVEYFNADGTGTYRAIIEGIDKDGNIGRQVFRYTVK